MEHDRLEYLLHTPREQLSRSDKRLQTMIKRYGSVAGAMKSRDVSDLVLGGYNGGIKKSKNKGFGSWDKEKITEFAKSRKRDSRGRFIQETDR